MTRLETNLDASEACCRQLGDLAAQAAPTPPVDPRQWSQIEDAMDRRPSRHRWLLLLAPAMAATGLVLWLHARRPLEHSVQGCQVAADGRVSAPADRECRVVFEEGTQITLAKSTQGRIDSLTYRRGASFALDRGHVDLAVVHRPSAQWDVAAGPFDVHVTGTRFAVDWAPDSRHFTLRVSEGEVRVSGCSQRPGASVRAGQGLEGDASGTCTNIEPPAPLPPAPPAPVAQAQAPRVEPTAPRAERKRATGSGRLAMRNPDPAGKLTRPASPAAEPSTSQLTARDWSASSGLAPEIMPGPRRLTVGSNGRLTGPEPGSLLAIGGVATAFAFPTRPVGNIGAANGIIETPPKFEVPTKSLGNNLYLEDGALCTRGKIAALACEDEKIPTMRCDWDSNWGVLIQWRPREGQVWGNHAASSVALEYRGKSTRYRLVAHRQGDPDDRTFCVENYHSGRTVTPSQFTASCWKGGGTQLPDFSKVDYFSLQVTSEETAQRFHFCVSAIDLR